MQSSREQPAGWTATARGRRELAAVALFCLLNTVIPLVVIELYPFSRAPMFADAPQQYCDYQVFLPDGQAVKEEDLKEFGLQRNYWGNPVGAGGGIKPKPTVDRFGQVASEEEVRAMVEARLAARPELAYVEVVQEVNGPVTRDRIGVLQSRRWRIANPQHSQP